MLVKYDFDLKPTIIFLLKIEQQPKSPTAIYFHRLWIVRVLLFALLLLFEKIALLIKNLSHGNYKVRRSHQIWHLELIGRITIRRQTLGKRPRFNCLLVGQEIRAIIVFQV